MGVLGLPLTLFSSIRESLQLGKSPCPIKKGCILEGELVVYSDKVSQMKTDPSGFGSDHSYLG